MEMQSVHDSIMQHAKQCSPEECCGIVIAYKGRLLYVPCTNVAKDKLSGFEIDAKDYVYASSLGEPLAIVHSHPYGAPVMSPHDIISCRRTGLKWIIVNPQTEEVQEYMLADTSIPLYGRSYAHGVSDCYSFAIDYYRETLGITLPDFPRVEEWWDKGFNMYRDYFYEVGFREIPKDEIRAYDGLLMTITSTVMNHGAVYLGDNLIGHHLYRRLSSKDVYGQFYRNRTKMAIRHKDLF